MARKIGEAFIRVRPDTAGFARAAQPAVAQAGRNAGLSFAAGFGGVITGTAVIAGLRAVGGAIRSMFEEARDAARIGRLTDAVIKSTGGAARVSATQVEALADRIAGLAGVDDELVQSGANILLTFTNVKNVMGRGNAIFDQATQAAVNMTAALNHGAVTQDKLKGASLLVGKALNDPLKGMTALRKAGVSFTQQQQDQIRKLVESGRTLDAQKLIIAELNKEFGGAAAAAADPAQRAQVAWANFKEELGGAVMPIVGRLADLFTTKLLPGLQLFFNALRTGKTEDEGTKIESLALAIRRFVEFLQQRVLPILAAIGRAVRPVLEFLTSSSTWAGVLRAALGGVVVAILAIVTALKVWTAIQTVLNVVLTANPIGLIIIAIAALVAGIIYAYRNSETFRRIVQAAWTGIKIVVMAVVNWITGTAVPFLIKAWNMIVAGVKFVIAMFRFYWNLGVAIVRAVTAWIENRIRIFIANVRFIIGRIREVIAIFRAGFDRARAAVVDRIAAVIAYVRSIPGRIRTALGNLASTLFEAGADLVRGLWNGIKSLAGWIRDRVVGFIADNVPGPIRKLLGLASPSKLFAKFGRDTVRGYVIGIESEAGNVTAAITRKFGPGRGPGPAAGAMADASLLERALRRAMEAALSGARLIIDDRTGKLADLYGRAG